VLVSEANLECVEWCGEIGCGDGVWVKNTFETIVRGAELD
jgi:hypothetical protein